MNKSINLDFKIPIWKPDKEQIKESNLTRYIEWLNKEKNLKFIMNPDSESKGLSLIYSTRLKKYEHK